MATLVISPEIERDAERLALCTGTTPEQAVANALRECLRAVDSKPRRDAVDLDALHAFLENHRGPVDYSLSEDEILGYDESGAPEQPWLDDRR